MNCEWQGCDQQGSRYVIWFEDSERELQLCLDHTAQLHEQLAEKWGRLSDAGDFNATVLLVLLLRRIRPYASFRLGIRAIRYAWRDRNWRGLRHATSGWIKLTVGSLLTAEGGLYGVILIFGAFAALVEIVVWATKYPTVAIAAAILCVLAFAFAALLLVVWWFSRSFGRPVLYFIATAIAFAVSSWLTALAVLALCVLIEIAISLRRLVTLAESRTNK